MLILSTASLQGYGLHKIFTFAKKADYKGINLDIEKGKFDTWNEEYIKTLSDAFQIPIVSITAPSKGMNKKKLDKIIKMAIFLQTQVVSFSPPHMTDKNVEWFTSSLAKVRRDNRISIAIQNVPSKFWLFVIPEYKNNTLTEIKRITGDTALNIANIDKSSGFDILKAQKLLGNTIRNIYFSDKNSTKGGLLPGNSGGGVSYLPLESFLMKLRTLGYDGYITLKVKPAELGAGNDEKVLQNLEYVKKYFKKHFLDYKTD